MPLRKASIMTNMNRGNIPAFLLIERISCIDFYWHTLSAKGKGLAYYGITLIPPDSLKAFIDAIADIPKLCELKKLLEEALDQNKWMIHYGI